MADSGASGVCFEWGSDRPARGRSDDNTVFMHTALLNYQSLVVPVAGM